MTSQEAHARANAALTRSSAEVFAHLLAQVDELLTAVAQALTARPRVGHPAQVALMSVLRLKQEAHAVRAPLGLEYPVQGLALAAHMVELAYDLLDVRDDEARTQAWEEHDTLEQNVWTGMASSKKRRKDGPTAPGLTGLEIERTPDEDDGLYGLPCAAKHGNPLVQKMTGGTSHGDTLIPGPQDDTVEMERRSAALTMDAVFRTTSLAALVVLEDHVPEPVRSLLHLLQDDVGRFRERARLVLNALSA